MVLLFCTHADFEGAEGRSEGDTLRDFFFFHFPILRVRVRVLMLEEVASGKLKGIS